MSVPDFLSVDCPVCSASKGSPCVWPSYSHEVVPPHERRIRQAMLSGAPSEPCSSVVVGPGNLTDLGHPRGELTYDIQGRRWSAYVVLTFKREQALALFSLYLLGEERLRYVGDFATGSSLIEWLRDLARKKFATYEPIVDTLSNVDKITAAVLMPKCLRVLPKGIDGKGRELEGCEFCAFRSACGDSSMLLKVPEEERLAMSDEAFAALLKAKLEAEYK